MGVFIGVDVAVRRGSVYAVLDSNGARLRDGWLESEEDLELIAGLQRVVDEFASDTTQVHVGIDSPRMPIRSKRARFWDGTKRAWRARREDETGLGRHCEVVISAHRLANPQWTNTFESSPEWMRRGFAIFSGLQRCKLYEVFPSASYCLLSGDQSASMTIGLASCHAGPKDVLDAYVAAFTVREFVEGRGQEVGGGDGLGTIVLPRPIPEPIQGVLDWPAPLGSTS